MHYYQFNIGDYIANTARLSNLEDLCYRRLLDLYYLNERPFNECSNSVAREIGMVEQVEIVEFILNKYFQLIDGLWHQNRVDREILLYQKKLETASKAGKASAKARQLKASKRPLNARSNSVEPTINHKPLTNNHKPIKKNSRFKPPLLQEVVDYCLIRNNAVRPCDFIDHYESNGWMRGKTKIKDWKACVRTWENSKKTTEPDFDDTSTDWAVKLADRLF